MGLSNRVFPPLAALRAFEAVGRLGGIRRAAKELQIDHAVVSRHIRSLESWVDTKLIVRNASASKLTTEGEAYYKEIYSALTLISTATAKLMRSSNEQSLSLWCVPGLASLWLADRLGDFIASNPGISVDFRPSDRSPDFSAKEVHCDIRFLREWEIAEVSRFACSFEIARPAVFPVASPECVAGLPPLESPADLLKCPLLHEDNDLDWRHWLKAQGAEIIDNVPGPRLWHAHLTLNAARRGQGIALTNKMLLRDDLEAGRLVPITLKAGEFETVRSGAYTFLAREDRWNAPVIVTFRNWLRQTVADEG